MKGSSKNKKNKYKDKKIKNQDSLTLKSPDSVFSPDPLIR